MFYYLNDKDKKYRKIDDHLVMLYNHSSLTNEEIRILLDLTNEEFDNLVNKCYKKNLLNTEFRQYNFSVPKYYYRYNYSDRNMKTNFVVRKFLKGKWEYYCYCKTESEAKFIVNELKKCNWDKSRIAEIKNKIK